jgi:glucose/arabinose dehydrogenase
VYISYAEPEGDKAGTAVARGRLNGNSLENLQVIFRQQPKTKGYNHFGSRLVFAPDGNLFITLGERFDHAAQAQKLDNHLGKLIRIRPDGSVPADNPFVGKQGALPEIWSYGHRNMQGAAIHPKTGALWTHEHGPKGGDEINIPQAGKNYGWPEASYGSHYTSEPIPDEHSARGFEEPIYHWTPSIAPSGMAFYDNNNYTAWNGTLLVGDMVPGELVRLTLDGDKVIKEERLLKDLDSRIRDVMVGKDGSIYLLIDADEGQLLRMKPQ